MGACRLRRDAEVSGHRARTFTHSIPGPPCPYPRRRNLPSDILALKGLTNPDYAAAVPLETMLLDARLGVKEWRNDHSAEVIHGLIGRRTVYL